jgi:hypothetical protein
VHFACSEGETDPTKANTFPGSPPDSQLPTFICRPADEVSGKGLKQMQFRDNTTGRWKVALEPGSTYGEPIIAGAGAKEAAAVFDLTGGNQGVARFFVSMAALGGDVVLKTFGVMGKIRKMAGTSSVQQHSSGSPRTSHDGYPSVVLSQLAITMPAPATPPAVRDKILAALLGKQLQNLPPASWGPSETQFLLRFQTLLRDDQRILVMGAVATSTMANNSALSTGIHLDDLANGTGLATHLDDEVVECDAFFIDSDPMADIIWVVDESGSMQNNREDVAANAKDFFARAVASSLDFRMGITGVHMNQFGTFCSVISDDKYHDGGADRFLLPNEQQIFEACIKNPPGYEGGIEYGLTNARDAVTGHLPRADNNPAKIRKGAQLVVIIATDEVPETWKNEISMAGRNFEDYTNVCQLPGNVQMTTNSVVQFEKNLFSGKSMQWKEQASAMVHMIGGVCNNTCQAEIGHGYIEVVKATGGITADVCQTNLGPTLQRIIDAIIGAASQAKLQYVPISASLAVAIDQTQLQRSRVNGFDYSPVSNALVFIGIPYPKGKMVVASYRRYMKQAPAIE